jgi:hypothetical protein
VLCDLPSKSCDFLPGSLDALEMVDMVGLVELLRRAEFCITHVGLLSPSLHEQQTKKLNFHKIFTI